MAKTAAELNKLDLTRNRKRIPAGRSKAYAEGWRARECGQTVNPHAGSPSAQPLEYHDWNAGDYDRGQVGFDYSLRIGSGTRLGPFHY